MGTIQLTLHIVNGGLFAIALWTYCRALRDLKGSDKPKILKKILQSIMVSGVGLTTLFLGLQLDWILSSHNQDVGDATSWAWLLFDYGLAMYLLLTGTLMRVLVQWEGGFDKTGGIV